MDLERARRILAARKRRLAENARKQAERLEAERGRAQAETQETVAQERAAAEEKAKRETNRARIEALAAILRAFYYPKQAGFFRSKAERRATKKTRRSGATAGGCRELIARAIETPRFRAVYITETRVQAEARAWRNDTNSGLVDIIEQYGRQLESPKPGRKLAGVPRFDLGSVTVEVRSGDLALVFSNGSRIELFGADDEQACMGLRGLAKHVYWVDEAQDFRWLTKMYKAVISAGMADHGGECWLTGTPGVDLVGLFYEVTRDDGEQLPGWEVHHLTVQDNPFFGRVVWELGRWFVEDNLYDKPDSDRATHAWTGEIAAEAHRWGPFRDEAAATEAAIAVRWERGAGKSIRENAWDENDPDLLREWRAIWVKDGARLVYAAHSRTEHELCYAPMRLGPDGFPDIRTSLLDLPGWKDQREYLLGVGADLGTTRAFGWVMVAWSLVDPVLYEVASWKKAGLDYGEMALVLRSVQAQARVGLWVADAGGGGKPAVKGWSRQWLERYQLPILEAQKPNKLLAQKQLNTDIRQGHFRARLGSPLVAEWKVHRWLPTRTSEGKLVEDPATHRDLGDSCLYIHRESYHHRYRPTPDKIVTGTPEWVTREETEMFDAAQETYGR